MEMKQDAIARRDITPPFVSSEELQEASPDAFSDRASEIFEDSDLVRSDPNASVTDVCLTCHKNIMRTILYMRSVIYDIGLIPSAQERLRNVSKNLEENYLRLDVWISDSNISQRHDYFALESPIVQPVRATFSTIENQLFLLKEEINGLKQHSEPEGGVSLFPIEVASQSITSHIRILAKMQNLIHNAQVQKFPELSSGEYLQAQIEDVFQRYTKLEQNPEHLDNLESLKEEPIVPVHGSDDYRSVGDEHCGYCGKLFHFGTLDLHQELVHIGKNQKITSSSSPLPDIIQRSSENSADSITPLLDKPTPHNIVRQKIKQELLSISQQRGRKSSYFNSSSDPQPTQRRRKISWGSDTPSSPQPAQRRRKKSWGSDTTSTSRPAQRRLSESPSRSREPLIHMNLASTSTYIFEDLKSDNEIRLLKVLKGKHYDPVQCILFSVPLEASPESVVNRSSAAVAESYDYAAVSYSWVNDFPKKEVKIWSSPRVDGKFLTLRNFRRRTLYVNSNVEAALRYIRSEYVDTNVWIDALCIDRSTEKEISSQMRKIPVIFRKAREAFIWIGTAEPQTKDTFSFLREIRNLKTVDTLFASGKNVDKWRLVLNLLRKKWFGRRWIIQELAFAKDATIWWGDQKFSWQSFVDALVLLIEKREDINRILRKSAQFSNDEIDLLNEIITSRANAFAHITSNLFIKYRDGKVQQKLLTLEYLVTCLLVSFETTDPRDIIFALISIAKDSPVTQAAQTYIWGMPPLALDSRLAPNYNKSVIDVYVDFMDYAIQKSNSLDILCRHWAPVEQRERSMEPKTLTFWRNGERETEEIPSWIPSMQGRSLGNSKDQTRGRVNANGLVDSIERQNSQVYNASAGRSPSAHFEKHGRLGIKSRNIPTDKEFVMHTSSASEGSGLSLEPSRQQQVSFEGYTLRVKGYKLYYISEIAPRISHGIITAEAFEIAGWSPQKHLPEEIPDRLWRTLVADRGLHGTNPPMWYRRACIESLRHVDDNGDLNTSALKNSDGTQDLVVSFINRMQQVVWNQCFFHVSSLHLPQSSGFVDATLKFGLGVPRVAVNDIVCILQGCSVPVVLRKKLNTDNIHYFQFVGECYVHGIMDGEVFDQDIVAEEFTLR